MEARMGRKQSLILWECKFRCFYSQAGLGLCTWPWTLILPCSSILKWKALSFKKWTVLGMTWIEITSKLTMERGDHWASVHTGTLDKISRSVSSSWRFSSLQNIIRVSKPESSSALVHVLLVLGATEQAAVPVGSQEMEQRDRIPSLPCCPWGGMSPGHLWLHELHVSQHPCCSQTF